MNYMKSGTMTYNCPGWLTNIFSFSAHSLFFVFFDMPHISMFCLYFTCFSAFHATRVALPILSDVALGYIML